MPTPLTMAKKSSGDKAPKKPKQLGVATVVRPCLIGVAVLSVAAVALPH